MFSRKRILALVALALCAVLLSGLAAPVFADGGDAPKITAQPKSVDAVKGETVKFTVKASGADLKYRWYYRTSAYGDWTAVKVGGASATYSLTAAMRHDGYEYRCRVSNAAGSVYSKTVSLSVVSGAPKISAQPKDQKVAPGHITELTVKAEGNALSYQWFYRTSSSGGWKAVKINGRSATYALTVQARHDGYEYRCRVSNAAGSVYSKAVKLTVIAEPNVTVHPKDQTVKVGDTATFKVEAVGDELSYQWCYQKPGSGEWVDVKIGGTSPTYTLTAQARHDGYEYRCAVTNPLLTELSAPAKLTVVTAPKISTQPKDQTSFVGGTASFYVDAEGHDLSYRWYYRTSPAGKWTAVKVGGRNAGYSLTAAARHDGYEYRCRISNAAGSVYSSAAKLTIDPSYSGRSKSDGVTVTLQNAIADRNNLYVELRIDGLTVPEGKYLTLDGNIGSKYYDGLRAFADGKEFYPDYQFAALPDGAQRLVLSTSKDDVGADPLSVKSCRLEFSLFLADDNKTTENDGGLILDLGEDAEILAKGSWVLSFPPQKPASRSVTVKLPDDTSAECVISALGLEMKYHQSDKFLESDMSFSFGGVVLKDGTELKDLFMGSRKIVNAGAVEYSVSFNRGISPESVAALILIVSSTDDNGVIHYYEYVSPVTG